MTEEKNKKSLKESIEKVFAAGDGKFFNDFERRWKSFEFSPAVGEWIRQELAAENQRKLTELLSLLELKD